MAADEWRLCVNWLVQCKILPDDHRATHSEAQAFDLAQALRDGVLLCHLLNALKAYSVDVKDFSPRPQLSQFLCLKNIRTFLVTCEKVFKIDSRDLFEPPDLFDVKNFRKVLHTLSKLSKTDIAQKKGIRGFPPHNDNAEPEEDIYGNLSDMAIDHDIEDNEDLYDSVYQEGGDDEIYEDLCSTKRTRHKHSRVSSTTSVSELPPPQTKRDYCIKEMVDTERNYVDALRMIVQQFIKPLKQVISHTDKEIIFSQIENMLEVHTGFHAELHRACTTDRPKIHEVFIKWKPKFLIYGDYCSNLPKAQEHIEELTKKNEQVKDTIEDCERQANEARFRLRDLLHVPMQRVLKYHLLLRELIKNTDRTQNDVSFLQQALEAMQDLSLYVNEVKRDNEALALIQEIQNSITDLQMPQNTSLRDYGRLQKDGELKVRSHVDNKVRQRYIFLFDKVMLMGKSKGETYSFKEAIVLAEYKVDSTPATKDGNRRPDKWNCSFQIVKQDNSMAYTFFAKTEEIKTKWIEAINLALDNTQPAAGKNFIMTTFNEPKVCDICGKLLRGVFFQGYKCPVSNICVHKECIGKKKQEQPPVTPHRRGEKYKAKVEYQGIPNPGARRRVLPFKINATIEVTQKDHDWWKGTCDGEEGWFPSQFVEEVRQQLRQSKQSKRARRPGTADSGYMPVVIQPGVQKVKFPNEPIHPALRKVKFKSEGFDEFDWYVGPLARDQAGEKLKRLPDGAYLVRDSENPQRKGNPALSIKYSGTVRHIKIEKNSENMYYMADTRFFHSLPELIDFYQNHSLSDSFPEVQTNLLYPYKSAVSNPSEANDHDVFNNFADLSLSHGATNGITTPLRVALPPKPELSTAGQRVLSYATAVYDYAATATSQISLKAGERVAVLSKTGSDKGWWKGEHCATHRVGYFPFAYVREEDEE
ncbi:proto-oncogene vav-like isoform X3 [Mercenaria mercenaria]|uniref:proto-oncogene vav-like isoform X3 n=1 Tax=Mercenaria mercenaria TaxID=6596 RepID=UPI00234EB32E|nr:proto-oncogene vav-like isoform X3 [Mercenaria mercenaria]